MMLRDVYRLAASVIGDPRWLLKRWRGLPWFVRNLREFRRRAGAPAMPMAWSDVHFTSFDRFETAGSLDAHYFHQDLWAARHLWNQGVRDHVDVGSRLDGFVAHILPFCHVTYVDIRPLGAAVAGLEFKTGSLDHLPFASDSIPSLSCLHVIEHVGLGRYGDPVDPDGHLKAARELARVLQRGGTLLLGTPVGRERVCFDAHRVFDPQTIVGAFPSLDLTEFGLIDDRGRGVEVGASFEAARQCEYGCGLFAFTKRGS